jgi:exonuclease III
VVSLLRDSLNLRLRMDPTSNKFTVCTFNCRSVKSSVDEIVTMCNNSMIVCLQEHWLLPHEVSLLSNISNDFFSTGSSAVTVDTDILVGRPYGGTGILYHKSISEYIKVVDTKDARLSAIVISNCVGGPTLLVCAYLPTDYGTNDCLEEYIATCSCISALYSDCEAVQLIVAGDFNCCEGSRFYEVFMSLVQDNNLLVSDMDRLNEVFTYCNDAGTASSWIDHVLCSRSIDNMVLNCRVGYEFVSSDHKPVFVSFEDGCWCANGASKVTVSASVSEERRFVADWSKCVPDDIACYQSKLDQCLREISIPAVLFSAVVEAGCFNDCARVINDYH